MTGEQQTTNIDKYRPKVDFSALFKFVVEHPEAVSDPQQKFSILGTSINYVFLYNHAHQDTLIIPLESVVALKPVVNNQQNIPANKTEVKK